jgi:Domain of unknown function (DUF5666)
MKTPTMFNSTLRTLRAALLLVLSACGGGVETGGTGAGAYVQGPITGFGSVIVAGVRFDDGSARVEDADGTQRGRDELRLGMLVEVESGPIGDDGSGGRSATATRVRLASELLGPVGVIDLDNARIGVLGQLVRLTPATVVDGVAGGAAALASDDVVEVYGFFDPIGGYVATRIERRATAPAAYRVRGLVRDLDRIAATLRIGLQLFDLSAIGVPAGLDEGQFVRLALRTTQVGGRWPVLSLAIESRSAGDHDEAEVEGLISAFTSDAAFSVNGVRVDASNAIRAAGLAVGVRVKVRGRSQAGVLLAASVEVHSDDEAFSEGVDIRDAISKVDTDAQTLTLRGITVFYGSVAPVQFEHGTVGDLAPARRVRVRGTVSADRTRVIATRIEFMDH